MGRAVIDQHVGHFGSPRLQQWMPCLRNGHGPISVNILVDVHGKHGDLVRFWIHPRFYGVCGNATGVKPDPPILVEQRDADPVGEVLDFFKVFWSTRSAIERGKVRFVEILIQRCIVEDHDGSIWILHANAFQAAQDNFVQWTFPKSPNGGALLWSVQGVRVLVIHGHDVDVDVVVEEIPVDRILFFVSRYNKDSPAKSQLLAGDRSAVCRIQMLPANLSRLEYDNRTLDFC